jgi:cell division protein FtsB
MKALRRLAARVSVLVAVVTVCSLVAVQYEGILSRYLRLQHQVDDSRSQIAALEAKVVKQKNDVRRLRDPRGAIPEIHDRLKEFGPDEEMIYLRGVPSPAPGAWENSR